MEKIARFRRTKTGRHGANAARNFHRWVHKDERALDVPISMVKIPLRLRLRDKTGAKKVRRLKVDYPVLHLSSWFETLMGFFPDFFMAGHDLATETESYQAVLEKFWTVFQPFQADHPIYQKSADHRKMAVPLAVHGDEGRGLAKTPLLVISFQVLLPFTGATDLSLTLQLSLSGF